MPPLVGPEYRPFRATIAIQHWQLRNLVVAPAAGWGSCVVYPDTDLLTSLDLATGRREAITKTDTIPRCLAVRGDLIACGSLRDAGEDSTPNRGLVMLYSRATQQVASHQVGDEINNCVALYPGRGGADEAVLCNNDHKLYFGQIAGAGWRTLTSLKAPWPINAAAVDPGSQLMVLAGDAADVTVAHRDEATSSAARSGQWRPMQTLSTDGRVGIAVDFAPSGRQFAAAFEDGTCRVWDVRRLDEPLHTVHSTRPAGPSPRSATAAAPAAALDAAAQRSGAFRAVKFSDAMHDLLFVTEESGRVHAVDTRDFARHEVLQLPPPSYKYDTEPDAAHPRPVSGARPAADVSEQGKHSGGSPGHLEQDTRGLAWSPHAGGSLVVGSVNGIAVYPVPQRNVFPTYTFA